MQEAEINLVVGTIDFLLEHGNEFVQPARNYIRRVVLDGRLILYTRNLPQAVFQCLQTVDRVPCDSVRQFGSLESVSRSVDLRRGRGLRFHSIRVRIREDNRSTGGGIRQRGKCVADVQTAAKPQRALMRELVDRLLECRVYLHDLKQVWFVPNLRHGNKNVNVFRPQRVELIQRAAGLQREINLLGGYGYGVDDPGACEKRCAENA